MSFDCDVLIIGAGPAGSVAGALLRDAGHDVHIVEKQHFPRFSIGESLLPQCMEYLQQAGMLEALGAAGFQRKNGAAFAWGARKAAFHFDEQFTAGWDYTWQVERARFDQILAEQAQQRGAHLEFGTSVIDFQPGGDGVTATLRDEQGRERRLRARFALDASGFGRVLPRLLCLEKPSGFAARGALFAHIEDRIRGPGFDREKILITVHEKRPDVWFWLIPFADGRASLGVVGPPDYFDTLPQDNDAALQAAVDSEPGLSLLLLASRPLTPARRQSGYAAAVSQLHGPGYALLGNAGEFLDPVFSSGVTIALHSATLAADVLTRQLGGETVDWQHQFATPLQRGVDTFRSYVSGWYDGRFQKVLFHRAPPPAIKRMICSILAGYAWDQNNPYVQHHQRRLDTLAELCAQDF